MLYNSEMPSNLELNISKQEENLPMKCPCDYQFYFYNIQIVRKENFEEDYMKIYKKKGKKCNHKILHQKLILHLLQKKF